MNNQKIIIYLYTDSFVYNIELKTNRPINFYLIRF